MADELQRQTVPLVADAHRVVDQAATEMERVGAVLDTTESVHATVDSASRLAYRAFANPVVKVLAVRAGAATGIRRLASGSDGPTTRSNGSSGRRNGRSLTVPRRTFWLVTGAALGAGSSLWAERKVRRTLQQAAGPPPARRAGRRGGPLGPPGRPAAPATGCATRWPSGRDEMHRREEELWAELAAQGVDPAPSGTPDGPTAGPEASGRSAVDRPDGAGAAAARRSAEVRLLTLGK